jgi:UPF0755 protein
MGPSSTVPPGVGPAVARRLGAARGSMGTGQVPAVGGHEAPGSVGRRTPQPPTTGPVTARAPRTGTPPGGSRLGPDPTEPGRRTRMPSTARGWDSPPALGSGPMSVDDRIDGLAARATPPGGQARLPSGTGLTKPAVTPADVAHEAMTAYDDSYAEGYEDEYGGVDDDELDRSRRRGCGRIGLVLLIVAGLLCLTVVGGGIWVQRQIDPGGSPGDAVTVEVRRGQSTGDIGQALAEKGVITNASIWTWYVRINGGGNIQAGTYQLQENMSMGEALDALTAGPAAAAGNTVTIPEGLTLTQTLARLVDPENGVEGFTEEELNAALADPSVRSRYLPQGAPSLEGTLFPETYSLGDEPTEVNVLRQMVEQFDATLDEVDLNGRAQSLGLSPYEVLIVASLVEEETRVPEERAQVARVIYNRIAQDIPLQIDATSCYEKGEVPCQLTQSDLQSESQYNTRRRPGLPPTPIASPGRESIEAALNPADGDWLYYVLDPELGEGRHLFTADEEAFLAAKERCRDAGLGCG